MSVVPIFRMYRQPTEAERSIAESFGQCWRIRMLPQGGERFCTNPLNEGSGGLCRPHMLERLSIAPATGLAADVGDNHPPEPWSVRREVHPIHGDEHLYVEDACGVWIVQSEYPEDGPTFQRIVAAVNACIGIPTKDLREKDREALARLFGGSDV